MPIYAYRCEACGFAKDVLQKVSDPQLTVCLSCGEPTFKKQLTAAGFQLKGTGWYATDFRNGSGTAAPAVAGNAGEGGESKTAATDKPAGEKAGGEKSAGSGAGEVGASGGSNDGGGNTGTDKAAPAAATSKPSAPASGTGSTS